MATVHSYIPGTKQITYVSDVEGHWEYFKNFVKLSAGLRFCTSPDCQTEVLELEDDWHFVFGGDSSDKGPGTLRFQEAMVRLKRKYPDRVHLLLGNRDINKMALTSELSQEEVKQFRHSPGERRSNGRWRPGGLDFLKQAAAKEMKISQDEVTEAMIEQMSTPATKLKFMFENKMNSEGEFEFRRQELAILQNKPEDQIADHEVARSYETSLGPGGWTSEYLRLAQLGVLIGDALFVHGQIIGNEFKTGKTRGADKHGVAWCVRVVPGVEAPIEDIAEWLTQLNRWGAAQVQDWENRPTWSSPSSPDQKRERGGSDLMEYGSASTFEPSVVYCRWLTKDSMPLSYPPELVAYLKGQGVRYVVVGHTPHGNAPTVTQSDGITVVMCDTSFSRMKANTAFTGDNRGLAVSEVSFNQGLCHVRGITHTKQVIDYEVGPDEGDPFVGRLQDGRPSEDEAHDRNESQDVFFVKARLPPARGRPGDAYIMCNIQGFRYQYAVFSPDELRTNLQGLGLRKPAMYSLSGCGRSGGLDEDLLEQVFLSLETRDSRTARKRDLAVACTDKVIRDALVARFPAVSMDYVFKELNTDFEAQISLAEFRSIFHTRTGIAQGREQSGIFFDVVDRSDYVDAGGREFPVALGPFATKATVGIMPTDIEVLKGVSGMPQQCVLRSHALLNTEVLKRIRELFQDALFRSYLSPTHPVNLPEEDRVAANIPASAEHFAWCYPFLSDWGLSSTAEEFASFASDPDAAFLTVGGFIYFDSTFRPLHLNALVPDSGGGLRFGPPKHWKCEWTRQLKRQGHRWHPVTLSKHITAGAMEFCWIQPNEFADLIHEDDSVTLGNFGAFAYIGNL